MSGLDALYREVIMDHQRHPRGHELLDMATVEAAGRNPSCGDEVTLQLRVEDGRIADAAVLTRGCAISTASGSMLAEIIKNRTTEDARKIADLFRRLMHGEEDELSDDALGDLEALTGVRNFPVRVKCALLPWVTMLDALLPNDDTASSSEEREDKENSPSRASTAL